MALCNVTGLVYLMDGSLARSRVLVFQRDRATLAAEYLGTTVPQPVFAKTDPDGAIDVDLLSGVYEIKLVGPRAGYLGRCVVPDAATARLEDIIDADALPNEPPVWLGQVIDARDAAEAAQDAAEAAAADAQQAVDAVQGQSIVIVSDGQSNSANVRDPYAWSPSSNLYLWNSSGTAVGTAFIEMPNYRMNYAYAFADEVAKANPGTPVYLIQSGRPGRTIANWLPSPPDEDVYALTKARVEAALTALGLDAIDLHLWWQGESDSDAVLRAAYVSQFDAYIARIEGETWYPKNTPVRIAGVVSTAINGSGNYSRMNMILQQVAWGRQERSYFYTPQALDAADWLDSLHPTGSGYEKAGRASAKSWLAGGRGVRNGQVDEYESGNYGFGSSSEAGKTWDFRVDQDAETALRIANLDAGDNADAIGYILNAGGALSLRAWGALAPGRFDMNWSGTSAFQIRAPNAAAGVTIYGGENSETLRISPNSLHLKGSDPVFAIDGFQVLKKRIRGWGAPTGTATRAAFNTTTVTTEQLAERVKALTDDLTAHGMIGP